MRVLARWAPDSNHDFALGLEFSHETYGLDSPGDDATNSRLRSDIDEWNTNTISLFTEWQWRMSRQWLSILGGRLDKSRYSDYLLSPRLSLIYLPTDYDTLKLIISRSQRLPAAEDARAEALAGGDISRPEKLHSIEARYERVQGNFQLGFSGFYIDLDALGWDNSQRKSVLVGNQRQYGFEMEVQMIRDRTRVFLNHAYTQLDKFEFIDGTDTLITASEFGFGNDLNNWSDHITKLVIRHDLTDFWEINGSLRLYWGFPGTKDMAEFTAQRSARRARRVNLDFDEQFEEQLFLNLGSRYRINDRTTFSVNFYNLMGFIDDRYNKRIFATSFNGYQAEAPAFSLNLEAKF